MSDLVKRLRDLGRYDDDDLLIQAADEIERLQKLVDRYEPVYGALTHAGGVEFTLCEQQEKIERLQKRNVLLEDVAVAAEPILKRFPLVTNDMSVRRFRDALDKLREVGDDTD